MGGALLGVKAEEVDVKVVRRREVERDGVGQRIAPRPAASPAAPRAAGGRHERLASRRGPHAADCSPLLDLVRVPHLLAYVAYAA